MEGIPLNYGFVRTGRNACWLRNWLGSVDATVDLEMNWPQIHILLPSTPTMLKKIRSHISSTGSFIFLRQNSALVVFWYCPTHSLLYLLLQSSRNTIRLRINFPFRSFRSSLRTWAAAALTWAEGEHARAEPEQSLSGAWTSWLSYALSQPCAP